MNTRAGQRSTVKDPGKGASSPNQFFIVEDSSCLPAWHVAIKRSIDLAIAILAIPMLLPLALIVSLAIVVSSRGPVLFSQTRIGRYGRPFTMYKFRSMCKDADRVRDELEALNEAEGPVFKIKRDPRITRVGAFLRRSSIDELPQLINVLRGNMSLVGPRPPLPNEVAKYTKQQRARLAVKPGLTCLWQVRGRSALSFDEWIALDLEYIANQSILLDFKIMLMTIPAVIKGSGAW